MIFTMRCEVPYAGSFVDKDGRTAITESVMWSVISGPEWKLETCLMGRVGRSYSFLRVEKTIYGELSPEEGDSLFPWNMPSPPGWFMDALHAWAGRVMRP